MTDVHVEQERERVHWIHRKQRTIKQFAEQAGFHNVSVRYVMPPVAYFMELERFWRAFGIDEEPTNGEASRTTGAHELLRDAPYFQVTSDEGRFGIGFAGWPDMSDADVALLYLAELDVSPAAVWSTLPHDEEEGESEARDIDDIIAATEPGILTIAMTDERELQALYSCLS